MPLLLTDEQTMMRDSVRDFIGDKAPVAHLRKLRDSRDETGFSRELWSAFAEMGLCGLLVPEAHGGQGLGACRGGHRDGGDRPQSDAVALPVHGAARGIGALAKAGSERAQEEYLPKIASGSLIAALASDEKTKHSPSAITLRAERAGNGFKLNGAKAFVVDGHAADMLIVAARSAGGETGRKRHHAVPRRPQGARRRGRAHHDGRRA